MTEIFRQTLKADKNEMIRLYKMIKIKMYDRKSILCHYGDMGDRFFIILRGVVGVLVPQNVDETLFSMFTLFKRIFDMRDSIKDYKDSHSKLVKKIIDILTP